MNEILAWTGFGIFVIAMLVLDLFIFQRKSHEISVKESLLLTLFWISLALIFDLGIYVMRGHHAAFEFLTGYLVEESLSVDNIFVFLVIFSYFAVPPSIQRKALFWGILGAVIFRAIFVVAGLALIHQFHWVIYLFGAFLIFTAYKLVTENEKEIHPEKNWLLNLFRRFVPITENYEGDRFFVKRGVQFFATPLFIVVLVLESTDIMFAVDSIPAIFAITRDPFIVYTSNIFAILGLRALYFALAGAMCRVHYLSYGLSVILAFVGVKMLVSDFFHIPIGFSLGFIAAVLILSVVISFLKPPKGRK